MGTATGGCEVARPLCASGASRCAAGRPSASRTWAPAATCTATTSSPRSLATRYRPGPAPREQPSCAIPQIGTSYIEGLQAQPVLWSLPVLPGHTETMLGAPVPAGSLLLLSGPYWVFRSPCQAHTGSPRLCVSLVAICSLKSLSAPLSPQPTPIRHLKTWDLQGSPRPKQIPVSPTLSPSPFFPVLCPNLSLSWPLGPARHSTSPISCHPPCKINILWHL